MLSQQLQDRFMVNQQLQQRHVWRGNRIASMLLQLALMHLLLMQNQHQSQHFGVHGQISDPSTVQIGDMVWYVAFLSTHLLPQLISHAI
jgi:hypothetical protein